MGRAPAFWTPDNVARVRDRFVAVTVATTDSLREDAVGKFCRDAGMDMFKWEVRQYCVTADGRMLEEGGLGIDPRKALERWKALPEALRAPVVGRWRRLVKARVGRRLDSERLWGGDRMARH